MRNRILGLVALGLLALGAAGASAFFAVILYQTNNAMMVERASYFAHTWAITFAILGAAWVYLLLKTIFDRSGDDDVTYV